MSAACSLQTADSLSRSIAETYESYCRWTNRMLYHCIVFMVIFCRLITVRCDLPHLS